MVNPPDIETLEKETQERIQLENKKTNEVQPFFNITKGNLSKTSLEMLEYTPDLPKVFEDKNYMCFAVKKAVPHSLEIE